MKKILFILFMMFSYLSYAQIYTANKDWFQRVAEGEFSNYSTMEKFGENPEVTTSTDPEDVWDGGGIYNFSTTADIDSIVSSNGTDTQDITIVGLDASWLEVTQTITLTGQTAAALTTSLIRVYRAYNIGSTDIAGQIYIFTTGTSASDNSGVPNDLTEVRAQINDGNNQTLMCIYTIPAGKTGYFWGGYVSVAGGGVATTFATFTWRARVFGGVFAVKSRISCPTDGRSAWDYTYKIPLMLPEKTDVLIRCEEVSATLAVNGGFTVLLKDN